MYQFKQHVLGSQRKAIKVFLNEVCHTGTVAWVHVHIVNEFMMPWHVNHNYAPYILLYMKM